MGKEDDDASNAGEDSVDEEGSEVGVWEGLGKEVGEGFLCGFDEVHRPLGDGEDAEEHGGHGREEDGPSPEAVSEDGVELVGESGFGASGAGDGGGDGDLDPVVACFGDGCIDIDTGGGEGVLLCLDEGFEVWVGAKLFGEQVGGGGEEEKGLGASDAGGEVESRGGSSCGVFESGGEWDAEGGSREDGAGEGLAEGDDSGVTVCDGGEDGDAEEEFEFFAIDAQSGFFGGVDHVENDDGGDAEFEDLAEQVEIAIEVGGVEDDDGDVGDGFAGDSSEQDISGDGFVGGAGLEAIATWEVEQAHEFAVGAVEGAFFFFDGDAGVVADFLAESGEGVEEGCFSAVWVSDDGDASPDFGGREGSLGGWGVGWHEGDGV